MRTKGYARVLAVLLSVMIAFTMAPSIAFSAAQSAEQNGDDPQVETEMQEQSDDPAGTGQSDVQDQGDGAQQDLANTEPAQPEPARALDADSPDANNKADGEETAEGASGSVSLHAESRTNNIVGDVFANTFNMTDDPELETKKEAAIKEYPMEEHELSYYEGTLRVREIEGGDADGPNYAVYRDSYLIFSEKDSDRYTVRYSEDGLTAFVSPAITADQLKGKHGLVFLRENIGYDDVLVFSGKPENDGDMTIVPLKKTEDIFVSELFSDGKLVVGSQPKRGNLKASGSYDDIGYDLHDHLSGTNWEADITSFIPHWPSKPGANVDVFDFLFELKINLSFSLNYDITTRGSSNGRQTKTIAGFMLPMGPFSMGMDYNLQVKFDNTPIRVKGKMTTAFDYTLGTHGANIRNYRTEVTVSDLEVKSSDPAFYNRDIDFYIGSQIEIKGEFLKYTINLYVKKITIGPVLKIAQESEGGGYVKARHEKDQFGGDPDRSNNRIHTCAKNGEPGCLCLSIRETYKHKLYAKINLGVKSWEPKLSGSDQEEEVGTKYYHRSYTFGDPKILEGPCPHLFYRVPVRVWLDDWLTARADAGIPVTISDSLDVHPSEKELLRGETVHITENGKDMSEAVLFLPYRPRTHYTCVATSEIDGHPVAGSSLTGPFFTDEDPSVDPVNIVLRTDEQTKIRTNIVWNVDADQKDVLSQDGLMVALMRREAGTDGEWQIAYYSDSHYSLDHTNMDRNWEVDEWTVPTFGFRNGTPFPYEYNVRILQPRFGSSTEFDVIPQDGYVEGGTLPYMNSVGRSEPIHLSRYHISYADTVSDDAVTTTITATGVLNITVNKRWKLNDPSGRPESVYLALQQKPASGWESKADERGVPKDWTPIMRPLLGNGSTMKDLQDEGILATEDNINTINNTPLTIGKVNEGNQWKMTFTVPKYRSGVQLQYEGAELDSGVIERLLKNEYDLVTTAAVTSFGNYLSVPGIAVNDDHYTRSIHVLNTDPLPPNTIMGTVRWEKASDWQQKLPDSVEIHVFKNGTEISESPVVLNKNDYSGEDLWVWTLATEDYDPDAEYTVEEVFPGGTLEWIDFVTGLNVYNYRAWDGSLLCTGQAFFDYQPDLNSIPVQIIDTDTNTVKWEFDLLKNNEWWGSYPGTILKENAKDLSKYRMEAPDIPGYVKTYGKPTRDTAPGPGNFGYNFTVYYAKQSENLKLHIKKDWTNTDASTVYPDKVKVTVKRDGEIIAEEELDRPLLGSDWSEIIIDKDEDGRDLTRLDALNNRYVYTIEEEPVEGFTSDVAVTEDNGGDDITYTLTNRWVGEDFVNVKGEITWDDEEFAQFRPGTVSLSVINSKEEYVKTIQVPVSGDNKFEAKYLPGEDSEGNPLSYSVLESHVNGYAAKYDTPTFDESTRTWTCDVTNKLTGHFPLKIKKTIKGNSGGANETFEFEVSESKHEDLPDRESPLPVNKDDLKITGEGETTAHFLIGEDGIYLYSVKEKKGSDSNCTYDKTSYLVMIARATDNEGNTTFRSWVADENDSGGLIEMIDYNMDQTDDYDDDEGMDPSDGEDSEISEPESDTVEFTNYYGALKVEKKWDIDLEKKDRPDSIQALVQKKNGSKWESVRLVELSKDDDWEASVYLEGESGGDYRVRELKEETALQELAGKIRDYLKQGKDQYDEMINTLKAEGKTYWDALPDDIRQAADRGYDDLIDKLNAKPSELYDKLMEQLAMGLAEERIVYDSKDSDKSGTTNEVTFHVDEYTSVLTGGQEDAHITKYQVDYDKDGDTYTIENTAIIEIDEYKRWIGLGVDDDDMPDSVWMVLMAKPKAGALDNASNIAGAAGIDISSVLSYEFPLINPIEGGMDPIEILGELALGVDLGFIGSTISKIFGVSIPKIAVGKTDEDDNWKLEFVDKKYNKGIPMEYKGAELSSEIIRQVIKYLTQVDVPVSYNPFDNYISIPTKAIKTIEGIENPSDLLDLSKLSGAALNKAKTLTMDDIKNFGWSTLLTDYHLMANVINLKVDWDSDDEPETVTVEGKKTWKDDNNEAGARPESITIRLRANGQAVKDDQGAEIIKEVRPDEKGNWTWKFEDLDKEDKDGKDITYTITEDAVEDYTASIDGYNVTNTYTPNKTQITVNKVWDDGNNADQIRPESVTILLFKEAQPSEGTEEPAPESVQVVDENDQPVTLILSANNNWTESFTGLAKEDENGNEIVYIVREEATDVIAGTEGSDSADAEKPYSSEVSGDAQTGFTFTNRHTPENIIISGKKTWEDNDDQDGIRPESITVRLMNGEEEVARIETSEEAGWRYSFPPQPRVDEQGEEITYSVEEEYPDGYEHAAEYASEKDGYNITNTHVPETVTVKAEKTWEGDKDAEENRPESITIRLKADGEAATDNEGAEIVREVTADDEGNWTCEFTDLPKKKDGKEIEYTITEDQVSNYTATTEPASEDAAEEGASEGDVITFHVINTYNPGKTEVKVETKWEDSDDQDGIRPSVVTVKLLADGADTGRTLTLSESNSWTGTFSELDEYGNVEGSSKIEYTVEEVKDDVITGEDGPGTYADEVSGDATKGFTITNTHTPVKPGPGPDPDGRQYTITYKLNGGTYAGSPADIKEIYKYGTVISIHDEPEREGYKFLYWKGSKYQPGDEYTVTADHTFVAQWEKDGEPGKSGDGGSRTGDDSTMLLWIFLLLLSAAALTGIDRFRRRQS